MKVTNENSSTNIKSAPLPQNQTPIEDGPQEAIQTIMATNQRTRGEHPLVRFPGIAD